LAVTGTDVRDDWMKRTGPFYPLLIAFRLQSSLPVAGGLEPTSEDLSRGGPWTIGVGVLIGLGLAVLATMLLWSPLVPAISATLLVAIWVFVTGGFAERGVVSSLLDLGGQTREVGSGHLLAAVLVRLGLLLGTAPAAWAMALVVSSVTGKLAWLVATRPPWDVPLDDEPEREPVAAGLTPPRWGVVGLIAVAAVVAFTGPWGVGLLVAATAMGWAAGRMRVSRATLVGTVELVALVAIAIAAPATVSPLVSR
jgi:hypothetical protein